MIHQLKITASDGGELKVDAAAVSVLAVRAGERIEILGDGGSPRIILQGDDVRLIWNDGTSVLLVNFALLLQDPNPPVLILAEEGWNARIIGDVESLLTEATPSAGLSGQQFSVGPENTRHFILDIDIDDLVARQSPELPPLGSDAADVALGTLTFSDILIGDFNLPTSRTTDIPPPAGTIEIIGAVGNSDTSTDGNIGGGDTGGGSGSNQAPVIGADATISAQVFISTPLTITTADLLANDADADGDSLSFGGIVSTTHGSVSVDGAGNLIFRVDPGYVGAASITYLVSDGRGGTTTATVDLNITSVTQVNLNDVTTGTSPILGLSGVRFFGHADGAGGGGYNDGVGLTMRGIGDINGDGIADFIIDASNSDYSGVETGSIYIAFGGQDWAALDRADGAADGRIDVDRIHRDVSGYRVDGVNIYDGFGVNLSPIGDVTGDGRADLLVSAYGPNGEGLIYLISGASDLAAADGNGDSVISASLFPWFVGETAGDFTGINYGATPLTGIGDVNGDGIGDFLIGAPYAPLNGSGSGSGGAYLIYGGQTFNGAVPLTGIGASLAGVRFIGENGGTAGGPEVQGDRAGASVAGIGDIDGDGRADFLIGAAFNDSQPGDINRGAAYLVFGGQDFNALGGASHSISLSDVGGAVRGYKFVGAAPRDAAGVSVTLLGDINGDGRADFAIGTWDANNGANTAGGAVIVFGGQAGSFGAADAADGAVDGEISLGEVGRSLGGIRIDGEAESDEAGLGLSSAGDVNGDGVADFLIGARGNDGTAGVSVGSAYLIFGGTHLSGVINLSDVVSGQIPGFRISGVARGDLAGGGVAAAGDINNDGYADLLIGAPGAPLSNPGPGAVQIIFGGDFWQVPSGARSAGLVASDVSAPPSSSSLALEDIIQVDGLEIQPIQTGAQFPEVGTPANDLTATLLLQHDYLAA